MFNSLYLKLSAKQLYFAAAILFLCSTAFNVWNKISNDRDHALLLRQVQLLQEYQSTAVQPTASSVGLYLNPNVHITSVLSKTSAVDVVLKIDSTSFQNFVLKMDSLAMRRHTMASLAYKVDPPSTQQRAAAPLALIGLLLYFRRPSKELLEIPVDLPSLSDIPAFVKTMSVPPDTTYVGWKIVRDPTAKFDLPAWQVTTQLPLTDGRIAAMVEYIAPATFMPVFASPVAQAQWKKYADLRIVNFVQISPRPGSQRFTLIALVPGLPKCLATANQERAVYCFGLDVDLPLKEQLEPALYALSHADIPTGRDRANIAHMMLGKMMFQPELTELMKTLSPNDHDVPILEA